MGAYCSKQHCQNKCCSHRVQEPIQFGTDTTEPFPLKSFRGGSFGNIEGQNDNKNYHQSPSGETNDDTERYEQEGPYHKTKKKSNEEIEDHKRTNQNEDDDLGSHYKHRKQSRDYDIPKNQTLNRHASQGDIRSSRQLGLKKKRADDQFQPQGKQRDSKDLHTLVSSNYQNKHHITQEADSPYRKATRKQHDKDPYRHSHDDHPGQSIYQKLQHLESDHSKMKHSAGHSVASSKKRTSGGVVYNGQWKGELKNGHGVQMWPDGAVYEGSWVDGRACGKGKFKMPNGDTYEGDFSNDMASGRGVFIHNGGRFDGTWWDDLQHGNGTEIWANGSKYEGSYHKGKKQGYGRYVWPDKTQYTGDWHNNMINGIGRVVWADGRKYDGQWHHNLKHGKGKHSWPDGRRYEGDFKNDKRHGHGKFILPDGSSYAGEWVDGLRHGRGLQITPDNKTREGIWENGRLKQWLN